MNFLHEGMIALSWESKSEILDAVDNNSEFRAMETSEAGKERRERRCT